MAIDDQVGVGRVLVLAHLRGDSGAPASAGESPRQERARLRDALRADDAFAAAGIDRRPRRIVRHLEAGAAGRRNAVHLPGAGPGREVHPHRQLAHGEARVTAGVPKYSTSWRERGDPPPRLRREQPRQPRAAGEHEGIGLERLSRPRAAAARARCRPRHRRRGAGRLRYSPPASVRCSTTSSQARRARRYPASGSQNTDRTPSKATCGKASRRLRQRQCVQASAVIAQHVAPTRGRSRRRRRTATARRFRAAGGAGDRAARHRSSARSVIFV